MGFLAAKRVMRTSQVRKLLVVAEIAYLQKNPMKCVKIKARPKTSAGWQPSRQLHQTLSYILPFMSITARRSAPLGERSTSIRALTLSRVTRDALRPHYESDPADTPTYGTPITRERVYRMCLRDAHVCWVPESLSKFCQHIVITPVKAAQRGFSEVRGRRPASRGHAHLGPTRA